MEALAQGNPLWRHLTRSSHKHTFTLLSLSQLPWIALSPLPWMWFLSSCLVWNWSHIQKLSLKTYGHHRLATSHCVKGLKKDHNDLELHWILISLDAICQTRNSKHWKGHDISPVEVIHTIKSKFLSYNEAFENRCSYFISQRSAAAQPPRILSYIPMGNCCLITWKKCRTFNICNSLLAWNSPWIGTRLMPLSSSLGNFPSVFSALCTRASLWLFPPLPWSIF